jgi:ribonucleotide monophosphatase NagD (HAD superfamily)
VEVFFSNPDLLWVNEHLRPRFGQGAFAAALEALHRQTTGSPIACARYYGKPNPEPYRWGLVKGEGKAAGDTCAVGGGEGIRGAPAKKFKGARPMHTRDDGVVPA